MLVKCLSFVIFGADFIGFPYLWANLPTLAERLVHISGQTFPLIWESDEMPDSANFPLHFARQKAGKRQTESITIEEEKNYVSVI